MKTFNATNKPRTCLWCGQRLMCQSPPRLLEKKILALMRNYGSTREKAEANIIPFHNRWKDHYGKHNGLFCTDGCATDFACAAAARGYRFKPKDPTA